MTEIFDHKAFLASLTAEERATLTERSDAAGLKHFTGHVGVIVVLGALIAAQVPLWWLLLLPQGVAIAFLFTLEHEATHQTPFASTKLNEWAGRFSGLMIIQPFEWFRYFHLAHHKFTQDPERDPELTGLPKPNDWRSFAWHVSSIGYWRAKGVLLWQNAFGRINAPYLPERIHPRLRREARAMLGIYAAVILFIVFVSPVLLWVWLVPLILGFPILRIYLLAEHGRCPTVANMFDNTRTTYTNAAVRFLAWNMPYHTEHHVFPQVPFHQLPAFHDALRAHLRHTAPGYAAFTRDYTAEFGQN